ncbi:UvrD-helicase domain-containing protein [Pyxidicoccus sp. 3LG]
MSKADLSRWATDDLNALEAVKKEARIRAAEASRDIIAPEGVQVIRSRNWSAYREIATDGFSVRLDTIKDSREAVRYYLTKARQSLTVSGGPQVFPWTAPIARLRHLGPNEEEDLEVPGGERTYKLLLKGQYQVSDDDLRNGRYESVAGTVTFESAVGLIRGTQSLPPATVAQKPPASTFGLREIIFETDRLQDHHLRMPMQGHLVIEGAPGSGKTSIALQRAVYVIDQQFDELDLSRQEPYFTDENTLVITYSQILVHYLERLLRELRIPQVEVQAIEPWTKNLLDGAHALDTVKSQQIKDSRNLAILKTHPSVLEPLKSWTIARLLERWSQGREVLEKRLDEALGGRDSRKREYLHEFEEGARLLRAGRLGLGRLVSMFRLMTEHFSRERDSGLAAKVREALTTTASEIVDYGRIYLGFLESKEFASHSEARVAERLLSRTAAEKAVRDARKHAREGYVRKNDLPLLAWMVRWCSDGVPALPQVRFIKPWNRVNHLVIDEAQDLSPIQSRLLLELVNPRFKCVTAVGDLNQRLLYPDGLPSWKEGGFVVSGEDGRLGLFKKNYRQTTELGHLAQAYYEANFGKPAPFEARADFPGRKPILIQGGDVRARLTLVAESIIQLRRENPDWSVVLICDDDELREETSKLLKPRLREHHLECRRSKGVDLRDRSTIHITRTLLTKGLEFDCVCVIEPVRNQKTMSDEQALRASYVAITRAARHLILTCSRTPPPQFASLTQHFERVWADKT